MANGSGTSPSSRSPEPVVLYQTPWAARDDGWSIAARAYARAMRLGGLDVRLVSWHYGPEPEAQPADDVLDELCTREERATSGEKIVLLPRMLQMPRDFELRILSCTLGGAADMRRIFRSQVTSRGPQAYHCMFERLYLEPELVNCLNGLESIWAQCEANRDVLKAHGVKRVALIPMPYFDNDPHLRLQPPSECRRFYFIGRDEPRKAPDELVRAFLRAFKKGEATLTMKLSPYPFTPRPGQHWAPPEEVLLDELGEPEVIKNGWDPRSCRTAIRIIRGKLDRSDMHALHRNHDCYVSASRGEGLELGAFAAKLSGRVVVATDSGGPRDFLGDGDELVPQTGTVPADPAYPWGPGATYVDFRRDDLIAALQRARGRRPSGSRLPAKNHAAQVGAEFALWFRELTGL